MIKTIQLCFIGQGDFVFITLSAIDHKKEHLCTTLNLTNINKQFKLYTLLNLRSSYNKNTIAGHSCITALLLLDK